MHVAATFTFLFSCAIVLADALRRHCPSVHATVACNWRCIAFVCDQLLCAVSGALATSSWRPVAMSLPAAASTPSTTKTRLTEPATSRRPTAHALLEVFEYVHCRLSAAVKSQLQLDSFGKHRVKIGQPKSFGCLCRSLQCVTECRERALPDRQAGRSAQHLHSGRWPLPMKHLHASRRGRCVTLIPCFPLDATAYAAASYGDKH